MTARPFITMEEQAEDCAALIKKLQLPQMHIVGNCVGTGLVYYLLIHHPTLWKSAILLAPATLAEVGWDCAYDASFFRRVLMFIALPSVSTQQTAIRRIVAFFLRVGIIFSLKR